MSYFVIFGFILSTLITFLYLYASLINKKNPILNEVIIIYIGVIAVMSSIRIVGAVFSGQFTSLEASHNGNNAWILASDDVIPIILGALAIAWISLQGIIIIFSKLPMKKSIKNKFVHFLYLLIQIKKIKTRWSCLIYIDFSFHKLDTKQRH